MAGALLAVLQGGRGGLAPVTLNTASPCLLQRNFSESSRRRCLSSRYLPIGVDERNERGDFLRLEIEVWHGPGLFLSWSARDGRIHHQPCEIFRLISFWRE